MKEIGAVIDLNDVVEVIKMHCDESDPYSCYPFDMNPNGASVRRSLCAPPSSGWIYSADLAPGIFNAIEAIFKGYGRLPHLEAQVFYPPYPGTV
jgi:hypothetical protein